MQPVSTTEPVSQPRRGVKKILLSYFYWTYPRGCFHYDVMVTLILIFIFLTPQIPGWSYGDKPSLIAGSVHPIQVIGDRHRCCLGCKPGRAHHRIEGRDQEGAA